MNNKLLIEWLSQYKETVDEWLKGNKDFKVTDRYKFFNDFFSKIRENNFSSDEQFFSEFENMCDNIHSLTTNKLALARAKNKRDRSTKEEYIEKLNYLINKDVNIEARIKNVLENSSNYSLPYFGTSSISELVAYNEPELYTFLNQREKQAIKFLNIKINAKKFEKYFLEFNKFVQDEILPNYLDEVYETRTPAKLKSNTTLMLEIDQFFSWVFETKKIGEVESCFIDNIIIKNFYSITDEIELSELKDKNFIFLLGENGSGKTILLKAILITLKKFFIETQASKEITGIIDDILNSNKDFLLSATAYQDVNKESIDEFNTTSTIFLKNLYAYGTNRHKISSTTKREPYGFLTLFKNDEYLINVEEWIKDIERKELKKVKTITVKQVQTILKELLDVENLEIKIKEEKESKVVFIVNNVEFSLNQLSEGYISVISFVIDLIARLTENNPAISDIKKFKAVVLIDELDMFLHPNWEKSICNKLMDWFPQIQFFISTHSPILIQGAPKEKTIIFRLKNENNKTELAYKYKGKEIEEWLPNILISSPLFSPDFLDSIPKEVIIKARTEDSFSKMLETNNNIELLIKKEEELRNLYLNKLNKVE